jgi:surface antigen-like variable number repeat protein
VIRNLFAAVLLSIAVAPPLAAQETSFFIESIDIRGIDRISRDVLLYELRLPPGKTYSERELREANDRINRLAYVLSADFALEKGTDRGKYVLVIHVNETRVFFFGADLRVFYLRLPYARVDYTDSIGQPDQAVSLGWRFFVGKRGAVHFGLDGQSDNRYTRNYTAFAIGYTQYDLFGTRAFATVNIRKPIDQGDAPLAPQVVVGMPLTPRQTLTLQYDQVRLRPSVDLLVSVDPITHARFTHVTGQRVLKATWSYNTTNNPFFPTKGTLFTVTPLAVWIDDSLPPTPFLPPSLSGHANTAALDGAVRQWFESTDRDSWSAGVEAGLAHTAVTFVGGSDSQNYWDAALTGSYSHSLWSRERAAFGGDNRLEADFRVRVRDYRSTALPGTHQFRQGQASVSWARRNAWGVWRLGLGYAW